MRINPITKIWLFRKVKEVVFMKLDKNIIPPERGSEIIDFVSKYIFTLKDDREIEQFSAHISTHFPEIREVDLTFEIEENESKDAIIKEIMNTFMLEWNIDQASQILDAMDQVGDNTPLLRDLEKKYPLAYALAVAKYKK